MRVDAQHAPSPVASALMGRCPRCGRGSLFAGFLRLADRCSACGLDYDFIDAGDGPAVFIILVTGFLVTGGAVLVEILYSPPYWVHAALWLPIGIGVPLLLLRPFKAALIGLQYRHEAREGRLE